MTDAAVAAIDFALNTDEGLCFLRCWQQGEFDAIREEWPEAPETVFIGADPLYKHNGDEAASRTTDDQGLGNG